MREIKFRAWDKRMKKFHYPKLWDNTMPSNWSVWYELNQFTGLRDKNSVPIYEGDILTPNHYTKTMFANCVVEFSKGMFCFSICKPFITERKPLYKSLNMGKSASNDFEVIGNIYSNPELIGDNNG